MDLGLSGLPGMSVQPHVVEELREEQEHVTIPPQLMVEPRVLEQQQNLKLVELQHVQVRITAQLEQS